MSTTMTIQQSTQERVEACVETTADPVAVAPEWAFVVCDSADPIDVDYQDGQWSPDGWNTVTKKIQAESQIVGGVGSGATLELADGQYDVWLRVTVGGERFVRKAGLLVVKAG